MQRISGFLLLLLMISVAGCYKVPNVPSEEDPNDGIHFGGDRLDNAFSIIQTADNGYAMIGHSYSFNDGTNDDIYLLKVDANANKQWTKTYGGVDDDKGKCIFQTMDGGYFILGNTHSEGQGSSDIFFMKVDGQGNKQWMNTFGDILFDEAAALISVPDDGYYLIGGVTDGLTAKKDICVVKTSADGNELWQMKYGDAADEFAFDALDVGNGILILGFNDAQDPSGDIYLLKIDYNGNKMWDKTLLKQGYHICNSMVRTHDNNIVISGITDIDGAEENDVYLLKIDVTGNVLWEKNLGKSGQWKYDEGYDVIESSDQGIVISGRYKSAMLVMKTDRNGNLLWETTYGDDDATLPKIAFSVIENNNTEIVACGGQYEGDDGDVYFFKLTQSGKIIE